jgi:predicted glycoside hydrolase/deacetylase ChbG (UPF0249 family)
MSQLGLLFINADDWGRDAETTDRTFECVRGKYVSSVSAMVFMEDSERAAKIAAEHGIDAGLHLNLTTPFSTEMCPSALKSHQERIARHLLRHRLAQVLFHPGLVNGFEYVVRTQIDEYARLYGAPPARLDGHHHMHLCANVLLQGLIPSNTMVRRNFSFESGEKSTWNRVYRRLVDRAIARRHRLADYFFSLPPLEPESRLQRMFSLSRDHIVEIETHPVSKDEYWFLTGEVVARLAEHVRMGPPSSISW